MLAYTTVSDVFVLPSAVEAAVYIGGLIFLMACPYIVLGIADKLGQVKKNLKEQPEGHPEAQ